MSYAPGTIFRMRWQQEPPYKHNIYTFIKEQDNNYICVERTFDKNMFELCFVLGLLELVSEPPSDS